jgi:hypothetical protein
VCKCIAQNSRIASVSLVPPRSANISYDVRGASICCHSSSAQSVLTVVANLSLRDPRDVHSWLKFYHACVHGQHVVTMVRQSSRKSMQWSLPSIFPSLFWGFMHLPVCTPFVITHASAEQAKPGLAHQNLIVSTVPIVSPTAHCTCCSFLCWMQSIGLSMCVGWHPFESRGWVMWLWLSC